MGGVCVCCPKCKKTLFTCISVRKIERGIFLCDDCQESIKVDVLDQGIINISSMPISLVEQFKTNPNKVNK